MSWPAIWDLTSTLEDGSTVPTTRISSGTACTEAVAMATGTVIAAGPAAAWVLFDWQPARTRAAHRAMREKKRRCTLQYSMGKKGIIAGLESEDTKTRRSLLFLLV